MKFEDQSGIQTAMSDENARSTGRKHSSAKSEREVIRLPDVRMEAEAPAKKTNAEAADFADPSLPKPLLVQS